MSDFKTCDQLVEHFDENTKHLIDSDTYDLIRITWEAAGAAMCDENKRIKSERDALQAQVSELRNLCERLQHCAQGFYLDQGDHGHMEAIMMDYHGIMRASGGKQ